MNTSGRAGEVSPGTRPNGGGGHVRLWSTREMRTAGEPCGSNNGATLIPSELAAPWDGRTPTALSGCAARTCTLPGGNTRKPQLVFITFLILCLAISGEAA